MALALNPSCEFPTAGAGDRNAAAGWACWLDGMFIPDRKPGFYGQEPFIHKESNAT
jgi:hypothetical protein